MRFADDYVAGFEHREDAERFLADLRERFAEFGLELASGEDAADRVRTVRRRATRASWGLRKPETFDFLGFTHICAKDRRGRFKLKRVTSKKKMHAKLTGQDRDAPTDASPDPRTRTLARQRPGRALQLLRGARQQRGHARLPTTGHLALAAGAHGSAARKARSPGNGSTPRRTMATPTPHPSSLARPCASTPKPEGRAQCVRRARWDLCGGPSGNGGPYRD